MKDEFLLQIPAKQSMVLVARMALAGFLAQCGADVDTLEDVRTACDEACYYLIHQPRPARQIAVHAEYDGEWARIAFEAEREDGRAACESADDPEIARGILSLLVSDASLEADRVTLRLRPSFPTGGGNDR